MVVYLLVSFKVGRPCYKAHLLHGGGSSSRTTSIIDHLFLFLTTPFHPFILLSNMAEFKCYPRTDPNAQWNYCPSYGAAIAFSALFGLATVVHILQAILYKKPFAFVLIMGAAWETAGYIFRTLSVEHQLNESYGTAQQLLILLAPLWINAFVYMTLGRAIHFYLSPDKIFGIKARKLTLMFVLFDITAFVIQAVGGVMTTPSASLSTQRTGLHVYMGGVGLQLFFNVVFLLLGVRFQFILSRQSPQDVDMTDSGKSLVSAKRLLLYPLYSVLVLIVYRNIYRLIEFSAGVDSTITTHEWCK